MGNTANRDFKTHNARNGDKITILDNCTRAQPACKHHVNIKKNGEEEWHNELMDAIEIYRWFDARGTMVPKHFLYAEELLQQPQLPRRSSRFLRVISPSSSGNMKLVALDSDSECPVEFV